MIIARIPSTISGRWLIRIYTKLIRESVKDMVNEYSLLLNRFLEIYTEKEIEDAIDAISIVNGYVYIPTSGNYGAILRALEYGTSFMKAYKIISIATRKVLREGLKDEYELKL